MFGLKGDAMSQEMISIIDVARGHGKKKQSIFKVLRRLGVTPQKGRDSSSGNQLVAYISVEESELVAQELSGRSKRVATIADGNQGTDDFISAEVGVFYLIQLEPEHDPARFKVGFAASMPERLRTLRCSAPFATVVQQWPCLRLWEKTAIDCVSAGCDQLHTEVFRTNGLEIVVTRCQQFFDMMPPVTRRDDVDSVDDEETEHLYVLRSQAVRTGSAVKLCRFFRGADFPRDRTASASLIYGWRVGITWTEVA